MSNIPTPYTEQTTSFQKALFALHQNNYHLFLTDCTSLWSWRSQKRYQAGQNHQSINWGMSTADCIKKWKPYERRKALLEKAITNKGVAIDLLSRKR